MIGAAVTDTGVSGKVSVCMVMSSVLPAQPGDVVESLGKRPRDMLSAADSLFLPRVFVSA